jgi:hypothetical protein
MFRRLISTSPRQPTDDRPGGLQFGTEVRPAHLGAQGQPTHSSHAQLRLPTVPAGRHRPFRPRAFLYPRIVGDDMRSAMHRHSGAARRTPSQPRRARAVLPLRHAVLSTFVRSNRLSELFLARVPLQPGGRRQRVLRTFSAPGGVESALQQRIRRAPPSAAARAAKAGSTSSRRWSKRPLSR